MSAKPAESLVAASRWYALLSSDEVTSEDFVAWKEWKNADDKNRLAWQRIEEVTQRIEKLPPNISAETFSRPTSESRRNALKQLAVLLGVGTCSVLTYQQKPWREMLADYTTATGEIRDVTLPDGSHIFINTASAVNIRFTAEQRLVELIKGEILIHTAHENGGNHRPFTVSTRHGMVTALGTKFTVRDFEQTSKVGVSEGAVKVVPANGSAITIQAGQSISFSKKDYSAVVEAEVSSAWSKGLLVVYSMPLGEFIKELSRYRSGLLRCDPAIRHLLVSGSFFTADTDAILENLTQILPVRIESLTRYWVTLHAA
jgi:transmembrane sensor